MEFGKVTGVDKPVSRLVQGTVMISCDDLEYSFALLDGIFEAGCNTFDSAQIYGNGDKERALGLWMEARGNRDKVVVLTKGAHHSSDRKRVTPFDITADIHDSLARLKTDYIDLYILHRDDPSVPVGPIVEVLNEHYREGRILAFGGSNWTYDRVREANDYAKAQGLAPFAASSPHYSLAEMCEAPWDDCFSIAGPEHDTDREWYADQHIPVFAWSSLCGGFFSGRHDRAAIEAFPADSDELFVRCYRSAPNLNRLERATELAEERGVTVPQIALAFILNQPLNVFPLVGCYSPEEFQDNVAALDIKLSQDELDWLDLRREDR